MPVHIQYEPFPGTGQEAFWQACGFRGAGAQCFRDPETRRYPFPALVGPARIGKTKTGASANIMNALEFPARYMVLAPTYQNHMLMTTLPEYEARLRLMHQESLKEYKKGLVKLTADGNIYHKTERTITLLNESVLFFRSTDEPEYLYGPTLGGFHMDEAGLMPEDAMTIMQMRMTDPEGAQQGIFTFTPKGSVKHWTNRYFGKQYKKVQELLERGELGHAEHELYPVFSLTFEQNPTLPRWLVEEMKRRAEESPLAYQEYYGEWADAGGLIYPMFDPNVHMRPLAEGTRWVRYAAGLDFGLSAPTVVIVVGQDSNGRYWWCREFDQRNCSLGQLVQACRRFMDEFPGLQFYGDPSADESIRTLRAHYIPVHPAKRELNARVTLMWELLAKRPDGLPGLFFTPECVNSIAEIESWSWKPSRSAAGVVRYDDVEPHAHRMDAGGYALVALGRAYEPIPVSWKVAAHA